MYGVAERRNLEPGIEGRTERVVDESLVTHHVGGRGLLATPAMIGLMEQTAHRSVEPYLGPDQTTVGYEVCVRHVAPVEPGETVVVTSVLKEVDDHRLLFEVACTNQGKLVGSGTHKRAIVPARS